MSQNMVSTDGEIGLFPWLIAAASLVPAAYYCWRHFAQPKIETPADPEEMRRKRLEALEKRQKLANASVAADTATETETAPNSLETVTENAASLRRRRPDLSQPDAQTEPSDAQVLPPSDAHALLIPDAQVLPTSDAQALLIPDAQVLPTSDAQASPPELAQAVSSIGQPACEANDIYETGTSMASTAPAPAPVTQVIGPIRITGDIHKQVDFPQTGTVNELRRLLSTDGQYVRLFHQGRELRGEQKIFDHLKNTSLICRIVVGLYTIRHKGYSIEVRAIPGDSMNIVTKAIRRNWGVPIACQSLSSLRGPVEETLSDELSLDAKFSNDDREHVYQWVNSISVNGMNICAPNPPSTEIQWVHREGHFINTDDVVEEMCIAAAKVRCHQLHAAGFCFSLTEHADPSGRLLEEEESRQIHFIHRTDSVLEADVLWATWLCEEVETVASLIPINRKVPASDGYLVQVNFAGKKGSLLDAIIVSPLHVNIQIFSTSVVDHQLKMEKEVPYERIVMDNAVTLAVSEKLYGSYAVLFPNTTVPFEGPMATMVLHTGEDTAKYKWATPAVFEFDVEV